MPNLTCYQSLFREVLIFLSIFIPTDFLKLPAKLATLLKEEFEYLEIELLRRIFSFVSAMLILQ
ncbi:MAG: hypothetical protein Q7K11_01110 [Candidatus Berkelbacteria bacterium]|nr:hypothetical protein [Candidatus Berkelbacteria bacterium]